MDNNEIKDILENSKVIVVVGCSSNPQKAAHRIPKYMKEQGYKIIPVNPNSESVLDEKAYKSISDIKESVDIANIFRPSEGCLAVVKEAIKINPKVIWMQLGIINKEAKALAEQHGIKVIMDKCLMVEHNDLEPFRLRYNHYRPHSSLNNKTPAEKYNNFSASDICHDTIQ